MATHDANIENLRNATLGEQVRGSMIQLFEEDYNLVKRGISVGTDIDSASSTTESYYDGNVYINSDTLDVWEFNGTVWSRKGNLKGVASITTVPSIEDGGTNVVTITLTDGTSYNLNVKNGSKGSTGVSITGVVDNGDGTFCLTMSDGSKTGDVATIKGDKGDKGDKGLKGDTGDKGRDVTTITMSGTGKSHPITATYSDGTSQLIGVVNDGADGKGTGDMIKATYDTNDDGIVDMAEALSDGVTTIPMATVLNKADKANTLNGYGITDAYTKTQVDNLLDEKLSLPEEKGTEGQAIVLNSDGDPVWENLAKSSELGNLARLETEEKSNVVGAVNEVASKSQAIDDNIDKGFLTGNIIKEYLNSAYVEFNGSNAGKIIANSATQSVIFYGKAGRTYTVSASSINRSVLARYDNYPTINYEVGTLLLRNSDVNIHTYTVDFDGWYVWYIHTMNSSETTKATNIQVVEEIKSNREINVTLNSVVGGDEWVINKSYSVNDTCIYNNKIYFCNLAHTSSESILPTNKTYWKETSLSELNQNLNDFKKTPIRKDLFSSGDVKNKTLKYKVSNLKEYTHLYFLFNGAYYIGEMVIPNSTIPYTKTFTDSNYNVSVSIVGDEVSILGTSSVYGDMYIIGYGIR